MSHRAFVPLLCALLLAAPPLQAQGPFAFTLSATDSASIYLLVARTVADSVQAWEMGPVNSLAVPAFPNDSSMRASLLRSLTSGPIRIVCLDWLCPRGPSQVRLGLLQPYSPTSIIVPLHLPETPASTSYAGPDWQSRLWLEALGVGAASPTLRPPFRGGCLPQRPHPTAVLLGPVEAGGWRIQAYVNSLQLCA